MNLIWKVEGLEELETRLSEVMSFGRADTVARQTLVKAAKGAMESVYADVHANVPYGDKPRDQNNPIHMKDTVRVDARIPNDSDRKSTMVSQTDVAIATVTVKKSAVSLAQEFGTAKVAGKHFLRTALERNTDTVVSKFKDDLSSYIQSVAAKQSRGSK